MNNSEEVFFFHNEIYTKFTDQAAEQEKHPHTSVEKDHACRNKTKLGGKPIEIKLIYQDSDHVGNIQSNTRPHQGAKDI